MIRPEEQEKGPLKISDAIGGHAGHVWSIDREPGRETDLRERPTDKLQSIRTQRETGNAERIEHGCRETANGMANQFRADIVVR
jgi:hypothetical protein